ncbi:ATP-binding cassette domain-containing protein [Lentzea guizhouensis]|uniref:ATP-binding cassette domain-containing protein n=1 Tax=Lentzea guizhouensis TaxID=1586287 RepID=UPI000B335AA8
MTLHAELRVTRGNFDLDLDLAIAPGEVVALLGPNGAGKTTALRALAGLLPLSDGRIAVGERTWDGPGEFVPAEERPIGVVFQDYLLFAHMSALENVAFGLRARGTRKAEARDTARTWLDRVGLAEYAGVRPRSLSGGQASASHWPVRSPPARACSCSTNRWPPWTRAPACRSAPSWAATSPTSPATRCWSPTTRSTPWCWPTAW